jgi:hypothetical protein
MNYWHQYTIDAVQNFTFLKMSIEDSKNILNYCYKKVSFALLNGWNVTRTNFDHAWAVMEGSCLWAQVGNEPDQKNSKPEIRIHLLT